MSVNSRPSNETKLRGILSGKGRIFVRSRNLNILLFIITVCIMTVVMAAAFGMVTTEIASEYAESYATGSAEVLSAHIAGELALISRTANSVAVTEWMADEYNERKKALAYEEMLGIVGELYSYNLYAGVENSLNEYNIGEAGTADMPGPLDVLSETEPDDAWYFECAASENEYVLSVDIDHVMERKRVWLDYKVVRSGSTRGVISTGLEFSHMVGELFSHNNSMRGLIIDEDGIIHMDSSLIDDKEFLYSEFENSISNEFSDPELLAAIDDCMSEAGDYSKEVSVPMNVEISAGPYRNMTIMPIQYTNWAVLVLSGNTPAFGMSLFMPVFIVIFALLVIFALVSSAINYRLIFRPLGRLDRSLTLMKENNDEYIYGTERDDELGHLSQTIRELFNKANIDALTGIYNRRFMESNLEHVMGFLSRSGGMISLIMLDIDYFKKYNDKYGHAQGDICLKTIAQALADTVKRDSDFTARYGGEEFVAVLSNTDEAGARLVAEKLLENVRALGITHENSDAAPYVTVSIGVTTGMVEYSQTAEDYVKRADKALYMSKQSGRNRYTYLDFPKNRMRRPSIRKSDKLRNGGIFK